MRKFLFSFSFLLVTFGFTLAQSNTGNLTGTVADASGMIAGATVLVKDNQTGRERTLVTGSEGSFTLPQLEVGTYTITVTASGHKTQTYPDVKIDIGQTYNLAAMLEAGDISEVVTVAAGADVINSVDGEIKTTVSGRQIVELPLNGRNPLSLVLLQAGSSSNSAQNTTINGQRSSFTNIVRDGINVQDNFIRANAVDFLPDRPNVDDTGEFTIVTQNAGAESGYGASQVQLVTPRGSNDFHGAAYIYNRNSEFQANSFFNNTAGQERAFLNRNQVGGKVSGPIWKNRLFFFFGYEAFRLRQSVAPNRTILRPDARNGIFTYRDNSGVVRTVNIFTIANSALPAPAPGQPAIPTGIDATIQSRILANMPSSGPVSGPGDGLNTIQIVVPITSNQDRDAYSSRFDWDMNERSSISVVYTYKKELLQRTDLLAQQGGGACCYTPTPVGFQDAHTPFLSASWRWNPTNSFTNEFRGGYQLSDPIFGNLSEDPAFFIQVPLINNPETGFQSQGRRTATYNYQDNAVWIKGKHAFRFGGQADMFRADPFGPGAFGAPYIPNYVIGGGTTPTFGTGLTGNLNTALGCVAATGVNCISDAQIGTATSLLALLGGMVGSGNQTFNADSQSGTLAAVPPSRELAFEHWGFYGADQWKVTPSLTLNFGLRYDIFTPIREPNGLALEPVQNGRDIMTTILDPNGTYDFVGTNNGGHNFFGSDMDNIAPIVSFAWAPTFKNGLMNSLFPGGGKTVFRGGYRLSYVNDEFIRAADNALIGNAGLSTGLTTGAVNRRLTSLPTFTAPALTVPRTFAQNNALAGNFGTVFAIDPDLKIPALHEWSIGIQREIGFDTALEVRYVGSMSNNLVRGVDLNQVKIFGNGFIEDFNRARNNIVLYGNSQVNCSVSATTPSCQPLQLLNTPTFFNSPVIAASQNTLQFTNSLNPIRAGTPGELAFVYLSTFRVGNSVLLNNPNAGVVDLLKNEAKSRYNALQVEVRRRFSDGLTFQANYTFQKLLTDAPGTGQTRFEPYIDNASPGYEFGIGDQDTTHVFNFNGIYELPIGKGRRFFSNVNSWVDRLIGGWQATSIIRLSSGAPFSISDPRGTVNRTGRSGRQSAVTSLSKEQVKALVGVFRTPCGVYFIDPQVINLDLTACNNGVVQARVAGTTAGVASLGYDPIGLPGGIKSFPGQVFFNAPPGQLGNMELNFLSGPLFFNWDASLIKNIPITERVRVQVRGEAFNLTNRSHFGITGQFTQANINSASFGRLSSAPSPRILQFVARVEF